jgi:putative oxidoreductase
MNDLATLILRLGLGGLMIPHGYGKLKMLFENWGEIQFADPIGIGPLFSLILVVFAEFICSILVLVGFKTRISSIPLIITMFAAAFIIHGADPLAKKELALLYLSGFIVISLLGSGDYSIDRILKKK